MINKRLNELTLSNIEDILKPLNIDTLINDFSIPKARKK